jgi:hypothetical protein
MAIHTTTELMVERLSLMVITIIPVAPGSKELIRMAISLARTVGVIIGNIIATLALTIIVMGHTATAREHTVTAVNRRLDEDNLRRW